MIVRETTAEDIEHVLDRLSAQNQSEHDALGLNPDQALTKALDMFEGGDAFTALIDDRPACVFGVFRENGVWQTWFIATDAYFAAGAPAVRHARSFLRTFVLRYGALWTATRGKHPMIDRWFKALGYRKMLDGDGIRIFVYG